MKKLLAMLLVLTLAFSFVACNGNPEETQAPETDPPATDAPETEAPETEAPETEAPETEAPETENPLLDVNYKGEGVMTYAEYAAAALDAEVTIEAYVQANQSWWEKDGHGKITLYLADTEGAYFVYELNCSAEDAAKLVPGTKIQVKGYKAAWSGEVEIVDGSFTFIEGAPSYIAPALDVTALLGTDELIDKQNQFVAFNGMTVEASKDADGNDVPYLYKWNGSGQDGDDLYFNVSVNGKTYTFTVESYLCGADTEVYQAVKALNIGDKIDLKGFLYWYDGVNPHITSVAPALNETERRVSNDAELADVITDLVGVETIYLAAGEYAAFNFANLGTAINFVGAVDENGEPATVVLSSKTVTDVSDPGYWDNYMGTVKNITFTALDGVATSEAWGAMRAANCVDAVFENCRFINQGLKFSGVVSFKDCVFDGNNQAARAFHYCCPTGNITLENCTIKNYTGDSFHLGEATEGVVATLKNCTVIGRHMALGNIASLVFENCNLDTEVRIYLDSTAVSFKDCTLGANFCIPQRDLSFPISDLGGNTWNGVAWTATYTAAAE